MYDNIGLTEDQKEELKKIVLARIQVMPDDVSISVGGQNIAKQDLVGHIIKEDEIGEHLMLTELEFLQDLASGAIYANE
jgi:molybdopterin biosynthesis enzyme